MARAKFEIGKRIRRASDHGGVSAQDANDRASFNTIRPHTKQHLSYAKRMTGAFAATSVMCALVFLIVLGEVWEQQFQSYTQQNMQSLADATATTLSKSMRRTAGGAPMP